MSYYDRGYNNYNHHHHRGGFRYNQPRINENQVPQSKHTIFIRGLGGDVTTDEIKEYIGERVGKISFDFVKHSQDRSKMFVAVRFEKREEAKEFMDSYSEREFMGYRCELSWFRDIRRYCAYQRAKQVRSNSQRRRRRSDSEGSRHSSRRSTPARRSRSGSRENTRDSRSPSRTSRSPSRSRSPRSRSRGSDRDRSRSRSNDRRSRSNERKSRSVSRESRDGSRRSNRAESKNGQNDSISRKSDDETERDRSRKRDSERRESRSKRRREPSESEDDVVEEKPKRKIKEDLPQIPLPPKAPTPVKPKTQSYIPPPSVDMEIESPKRAYEPSPPQPTNPYQANQRSFKKDPSPANVHATSYAVPMEEEAAPRLIIREPQPPAPTPAVAAYAASTYPSAQAQNPYAQHSVQQQQVLPPQQHVLPVSHNPAAVQQSPAPALPAPTAPAPTTPTSAAQQPAFVPRQVGKIEICMPASLPAPTPAPAPVPAPMPSASASNVALNGSSSFNLDPVLFPKSHKLFGHLKAFQTALLSTVKYEPPANKNEDDELSTLRLSSFGQEEDTEESKALDREDKLARLSDEQMMRFHIKKKQFEAAFRNDCETYSVVTRALLNKDESLMFGLKMSLLENMEDLHKKMMQRVDDLLDQLLKMS